VSLAIDASLTMAWYFDDKSTAATDALLDRVTGSGAVLPSSGRAFAARRTRREGSV